MAAGIGDAVAVRDRLALVRAEFGIAVGPVVAGPVGSGGIDHPHVGVVDQGDRLARAVVRQAQEDDVRGVQETAALLVVVPLVLIDPQQLQIISGSDPVVDLQAGRPALPVNVYPCSAILDLHFISFPFLYPYLRSPALAVYEHRGT